jgi:aminotransferase
MDKITIYTSTVAPLRRHQVDTDQIIPAEFCKRLGRTGYADALFAEWRDEPGYVLARPEHSGAGILVAGAEFGIGSSREHAVWALRDHGFRVVVASSFGDIFRTNASNNGVLTARLPQALIERVWELVEGDPDIPMTVDLTARQLRIGPVEAAFEIPDHPRHRLLNALDSIAETLAHEDAIEAFERNRRIAPRPRVTAAATHRTARRTRHLRPIALMELLLMAREHGALDLATGTPSLPVPPPELMEAAREALHGANQQYDDPAGHAPLRRALAQRYGGDPDTTITVTAGATEGLNAVLQAVLSPGDEVVVLEPGYEAYPAAVGLAGGQIRTVRLHGPEWRWRPEELAAAFGPRTRAVIVNSPNNPTGRIWSADEWRQLARLCERWDCLLVNDAVYEEFASAPAVALPAGITERLVVLHSLSKAYAVSGWRIGWVQAPAELTRTVRLVHETLTTGTAVPLQAAAAVVVGARPGLTAPDRAALAANRNALRHRLQALGLTCAEPEGACYLLASLPGDATSTAPEVSRQLILQAGVAAAPGSVFFGTPEDGHGLLRFSFNKSESIVADALERLEKAGAVW